MSLADVALIASLVILGTAIVDWRRGVTGLGKRRLTKDGSPEQFWMALVLYFNMAFVLFWLGGQAAKANLQQEEEESSPNMQLVIEQAPT